METREGLEQRLWRLRHREGWKWENGGRAGVSCNIQVWLLSDIACAQRNWPGRARSDKPRACNAHSRQLWLPRSRAADEFLASVVALPMSMNTGWHQACGHLRADRPKALRTSAGLSLAPGTGPMNSPVQKPITYGSLRHSPAPGCRRTLHGRRCAYVKSVTGISRETRRFHVASCGCCQTLMGCLRIRFGECAMVERWVSAVNRRDREVERLVDREYEVGPGYRARPGAHRNAEGTTLKRWTDESAQGRCRDGQTSGFGW